MATKADRNAAIKWAAGLVRKCGLRATTESKVEPRRMNVVVSVNEHLFRDAPREVLVQMLGETAYERLTLLAESER